MQRNSTVERGPPARNAFPPPGKFSAARSHVLNDKYMEDFEKAWEELHGMHVGGGGGGAAGAGMGRGMGGGGMAAGGFGGQGGGGGYGPPRGLSAGRRPPAGPGAGGSGGGGAAGPYFGMSNAAAARAGSSMAAQQRSIYAGLEDPSGPPPAASPLSYGYGGRPVASPSRGTRPGPVSRGPTPPPYGGAPPLRGGSAGSSSSGSGGFGGPGTASMANRSSGSGAGASPSPMPRAAGPGAAPPGAAARRASAAAAAAGAAASAGSRYPGRVASGWNTGPMDPAGVLCDLSDRPNTCSAADWSRGEVVIGSTDHALYVLDAQRGLRKRTLYSKTSGHTEWVTCVTYCSDGRIVSGGMDSKLWVWPASGNKGMQAEGHFGPISQVKYEKESDLVVSASYDKTIRMWQLGARPHEAGCLQGHEAPVLEMQLNGDGRIVSGDRSGHVLLWDMSSAGVSWRMKNVHQGHVTALAWFEEGGSNDGCFVTGGQDGVVRVWDPRAKSNVAKVQLHVNEQGHGAVGDIIAGGPAAAGMVVTAGADGTTRTLDPRLGFALAGTVRLTNFPYSMTAAGGVAVVGCGDGSIHFIDIMSSRTLYALGANRAAVRCLEASYDKLVCSGDDGKAILYNFS